MSVTLDIAEGVAVVRLADGARRNPITLDLATALAETVEGLPDDVGAVALLAEGDHFCVGGDVRAMHAAADPGAAVRELADAFHRTVRLLPSAPPVVAGVRGWAAGAGMSLVLACDVVVLGESGALQPAYPGIGATPDGGMTWTLPRIVGERVARSLLLRNAAVRAQDALRLGIADEVVADADVDARAVELARTLAAGPREALRGAKRLVGEGAGRTLAEQLDYEAESISRCVAGAEGREGVAAFVERRTPSFGSSGGSSAG